MADLPIFRDKGSATPWEKEQVRKLNALRDELESIKASSSSTSGSSSGRLTQLESKLNALEDEFQDHQNDISNFYHQVQHSQTLTAQGTTGDDNDDHDDRYYTAEGTSHPSTNTPWSYRTDVVGLGTGVVSVGGGGFGDYLFATMSAAQSTGLSVGDEIHFDTVSDSSGTNISLNTTTHQFTLKDGATYRIDFNVDGAFSANTGLLQCMFYDVTNGAEVSGMRSNVRVVTYTQDRSSGNQGFVIVTPSGDTVYEIQIVLVNSLSNTFTSACSVFIQEMG